MQSFTHILVAGDSDWGKLLVPLVVFVMWALSALAKKVNQAADKEKMRQVREHIQAQRQAPVGLTGTPRAATVRERSSGALNPRSLTVAARESRFPQPVTRQQPPRRMPSSPRPVMIAQSPQRTKVPKQRGRATNYNQLVAPAAQQPAPPARPDVAAAPTAPIMASPAAPRSGNVNAVALHRWLRPMTLRRQFMLTEVLQPPVALRADHLA